MRHFPAFHDCELTQCPRSFARLHVKGAEVKTTNIYSFSVPRAAVDRSELKVDGQVINLDRLQDAEGRRVWIGRDEERGGQWRVRVSWFRHYHTSLFPSPISSNANILKPVHV